MKDLDFLIREAQFPFYYHFTYMIWADVLRLQGNTCGSPKFPLSFLKGKGISVGNFKTLETIKVTSVDLYWLGRRQTVPGFSPGVADGCRGYQIIDLAGDIEGDWSASGWGAFGGGGLPATLHLEGVAGYSRSGVAENDQ